MSRIKVSSTNVAICVSVHRSFGPSPPHESPPLEGVGRNDGWITSAGVRSLFTTPARNQVRLTVHRNVLPSSVSVQSSVATASGSDAFEPNSLMPLILTWRPASITDATPPLALYQPV